MVNSMTGFGRGEAINSSYKVIIEMKSVNSRYLETSIRMPKQIISLEEPIKKMVGAQINRGRIDIFVTLEESAKPEANLKVDTNLALAYQNAIDEIADVCKISGKYSLTDLIALPGLFAMEKPDADIESIWGLLQQALGEALGNLQEMRSLEGEKLGKDLLQRVETVLTLVKAIEDRAPDVVLEYQKKLGERIKELLADKHLLDEMRFANEVAFFADKSSITEELIRLYSHLEHLSELLKEDAVVGRKLDFLLQEINREVNTIGSKANDLCISRLVIDAKSELEKIREQVQNIE